MPRTGRTTVEFEAAGHNWLAETFHQHGRWDCLHSPHCVEPERDCQDRVFKGVMYQPTGADRPIEVKHITTVKLRYKDGLAPAALYITGSAPCSLKDEYNWRKGLHYAMQRALEKAGFCKLAKDKKGRVVVAFKKPIYNEIMRAFWHEVTNRPVAEPDAVVTPPAAEPVRVVEAVVVSDPPVAERAAMLAPPRMSSRAMLAIPHRIYGSVPRENMHGLGHCGMD